MSTTQWTTDTTLLILLGEVNQQPTQRGSAANSEDLQYWSWGSGGLIDNQLREDLQCWSFGGSIDNQLKRGSAANPERICTACWSWVGWGQLTTKRGSTANRGSAVLIWGLISNQLRICSQFREYPHKVLILGSINNQLKRGSAVCWSWGEVNWQPIQRGSAANSERICTECVDLYAPWHSMQSTDWPLVWPKYWMCFFKKITFINFKFQLCLPKPLKNHFQMFQICRHIGTINQNIIQIAKHKIKRSQHLINQSLKVGRSLC